MNLIKDHFHDPRRIASRNRTIPIADHSKT
jgi:hypothetical protein